MAGVSLAPRRRPDLPVVRATPGIGPVVILAGVLATPVGLAVALDRSSYEVWLAFIWAPILLGLALPLCRWAARTTGEPLLAGFLFAAAALKIVIGAVLCLWVNETFYQGSSDANRYDRVADGLIETVRGGVFTDLGQISGTRFLEVLTAVVQAVIGDSKPAAFLAFSAMGFVGLLLLYVAFCQALPQGDRRLYRLLLFLTPTMWFWPSSIGKEAFLLMCVGATAFGFVRLTRGHPIGGLPIGLLGLWGVVVVRPHLALVLVAGGIFAWPPSHTDRHDLSGARRALSWILPLLVVAAVPVVASRVEAFFGIEELNVESATEVREEVRADTARGDSGFVAPDTSNLPGMLLGIATVVGRPFPGETTGFTGIAASLETAAMLAVLAIVVLRRRLSLVSVLRQRWTRFALGYVLAFAWGFSVVNNFGILVRQRSLMLPFLFVLVAATQRTAAGGNSRSASSVRSATAMEPG